MYLVLGGVNVGEGYICMHVCVMGCILVWGVLILVRDICMYMCVMSDELVWLC